MALGTIANLEQEMSDVSTIGVGFRFTEDTGATVALGKRKRDQPGLWVATTDLPKSPGHPFYGKAERTAGGGGFRPLGRKAVPTILRRDHAR